MGVSTSSELSFRLCGFSVYKAGEITPNLTDKYFCRSVTRQNLYSEITKYFHSGKELRMEVVRYVIEELEVI